MHLWVWVKSSEFTVIFQNFAAFASGVLSRLAIVDQSSILRAVYQLFVFLEYWNNLIIIRAVARF